jgi:signal transduction histidine kinase
VSVYFERMRQLMRTSAIRLALRYALLQVLVLAVALASLFWVVNRYVGEQISVSLATEAAALRTLPPAILANRVEALAATHSQARGARHYLLLDAHGRRLAGNIKAWPDWLKPDGILAEGEITVPEADDAHDDHEISRLPALGLKLADGGRLLIAQDPGTVEDLRAVLALTASLAIVLGLALGWQWLKRVNAIDRTASRIAAGDLSQRVEACGRGDEFDLLAGHLNSMLERIEQAVAGMREVSDNVAHDLRRPLARLKTRIDVLLAQPRSADDYRNALAQTAQDADELMHTFDALLSIARLEAGSEIASPEVFDLTAITRSVAELYADEAEEVARPFGIELPDTQLPVSGQPALVSQAFVNLLDNAFKYTASNVKVTVRLGSSGGQANLEVIDHGNGLATDERTRMTERFARGDEARSTPGSGLGLALVKAIMHAHGGELELDDTPGGGLTARLRLPLASLA